VRRAALERLVALILADAPRHDDAWKRDLAAFVIRTADEVGAGGPLFELVARFPEVAEAHASRLDETISSLATARIPELARCSAEHFVRLPARVRVHVRDAGLAPANAPHFHDELESGSMHDLDALHDALIESIARGDRANADLARIVIEAADADDVDAALAAIALRDDRLELLADGFALTSQSRGECIDVADVTRTFVAAEREGVDLADLIFLSIDENPPTRGDPRLAAAHASSDPMVVEVARRLEVVASRRPSRQGGPRPTIDSCERIEDPALRNRVKSIRRTESGTWSAFVDDPALTETLRSDAALECLEARLGSGTVAPVVEILTSPLGSDEELEAFAQRIANDPSLVSPVAGAYFRIAAREHHHTRNASALIGLASFSPLDLARGTTPRLLATSKTDETEAGRIELAIRNAFLGQHGLAAREFQAVAESSGAPDEFFALAGVAFALAGDAGRAAAMRLRTDASGALAIDVATARIVGVSFSREETNGLLADRPPLPPRAPGWISPISGLAPEEPCPQTFGAANAGTTRAELVAPGSARGAALHAFVSALPSDARGTRASARRDPATFCERGAEFLVGSLNLEPAFAQRRPLVIVEIQSACASALRAGANLRRELVDYVAGVVPRLEPEFASALLELPPLPEDNPLVQNDRGARMRAASALGRDDEAIRLRLEAAANGILWPIDAAVIRNARRLASWLELVGLHDPYVYIALGDYEVAINNASDVDKPFFEALLDEADEVDEVDDPEPIRRTLGRRPEDMTAQEVAAVARAARTSRAAAYILATLISNRHPRDAVPPATRRGFARLPTVRAILEEEDAEMLGYVLVALHEVGAEALLRSTCEVFGDDLLDFSDEPTSIALEPCLAYVEETDEEENDYSDDEY